MPYVNEPRRSAAAVRQLEELQAQFHAEAGRSRDGVDYPNKIPDMAEMEVMHEFLTEMGNLSGPASTEASIQLVGNSKYQAAVKRASRL